MESSKTKKHNTRKILVIIVSIIALIVGYAVLRTNYLEMKEIGDEYANTFYRSTIYYCFTFVINFVILFLAFFLTNKQIKKINKNIFR